MKLYKPKFERVKEEFEVNLPVEPLYYFSRRTAYRLVPIWSTWNMEKSQQPEFITQYDITIVCREWENSIKRFKVNFTESSLQQYLDFPPKDTYRDINLIYDKLINWPNDDLRTKEQFEADFNAALEEIIK